MAFDKTQPTDSTKLRNIGTVIRPSWVAIESADSSFIPEALNLANRTPLAPPNDPVAIAETVILYSKDDSDGDPQLFVIDDSSNIFQLSGNQVTNSANGGTAGGTIYKTEIFIKDGQRYVTYGGLTSAANGSATIVFPENFTTIISASASANAGFPYAVGIVPVLGGATIYRGTNLTGVHYTITGLIT